jgi:hypothetical protein
MKLGVPELMLVLVFAAIVAVAILPWVFIYRKAGYSGWFAIIEIVPIANFIALIWFAATQWPIEAELERLKGSLHPAAVSQELSSPGSLGFKTTRQ